MLFNSLEFALFFPFVTLLYFVLPHRVRWALLLGASAWFYMAFVPAYIGILALTILIDYVAGIRIEAATGVRRSAGSRTNRSRPKASTTTAPASRQMSTDAA